MPKKKFDRSKWVCPLFSIQLTVIHQHEATNMSCWKIAHLRWPKSQAAWVCRSECSFFFSRLRSFLATKKSRGSLSQSEKRGIPEYPRSLLVQSPGSLAFAAFHRTFAQKNGSTFTTPSRPCATHRDSAVLFSFRRFLLAFDAFLGAHGCHPEVFLLIGI